MLGEMNRQSGPGIHEYITRLVLALALMMTTGELAVAQSVLQVDKNLEVLGVPPVPAALASEVAPYTQIYGLSLAGWDPQKREIWLKGLSSATWISKVKSPKASPETSSIYIQTPGIYDVYFQPQYKYVAYTKDTDGDETFQLYIYEIDGGETKQLSDGKSRNTEPVWSNAGDQIVYSSSPSGADGVNLRVLNPFEPKTDRLLVQSSGSYLKAYAWSPDDKHVVVCDFHSNTTGTLWLVEAATGKKDLLSPRTDQPEYYDYPQFAKDGKAVYVLTDHDSDVRRIARIDLRSGKFNYVPSASRWDVDEFQLSPDGKMIAFTTNEDGISRLHLFDVVAAKETAAPTTPLGVISDLKWHSNSADLAFNFKSPRAANDVYALNVATSKVELWAGSVTNGVDTEKFSLPEVIHWASFDKRNLSGFLYRPPVKFAGKRPVIIDIHGGPEEQYRPTFEYEHNYFLNELGVAKIYPNVRGSSGYGKRFLKLDNGLNREDAVKDIGALLEWIKTQPDLDAERVMVEGASYGGYLALSTAYVYSDQIRGAISDSGISNLATFVARTEGWRRGLQRAEFGDERDAKMKEFMERIAPLNNARRINKPLLLIQGQNDARIPASDTDRFVSATKDRIPVWYVLAKNEGHGFAQLNNRNYRLYATILFVKEFLLK
jgi:dipeptidyl aminopeptidase/acylaminoacyl peptidase